MKKKTLIGGAVALAIITGGGYAVGAAIDAETDKQVQTVLTQLRSEGKVDIKYESLSAGVLSNQLVFKGIVVRSLDPKHTGSPPVHIDNLSVAGDTLKSGETPDNLDLTFEGVHIDLKDVPVKNKTDERLKAYLGDEVRIHGELHYHLDTTTHNAETSGKLSADKLGALDFNLQMGNVTKPKPGASEEEMQQVAMNMTLKTMELGYRDEGLVNFAMEAAAQDKGLSKADFQAKMKQGLEMSMAQVKAGGAETAWGQEAQKFLLDPKSLRFRLAPQQEVPMMGLMGLMFNPGKTLQDLNFSIQANQ